MAGGLAAVDKAKPATHTQVLAWSAGPVAQPLQPRFGMSDFVGQLSLVIKANHGEIPLPSDATIVLPGPQAESGQTATWSARPASKADGESRQTVGRAHLGGFLFLGQPGELADSLLGQCLATI